MNDESQAQKPKRKRRLLRSVCVAASLVVLFFAIA
jgi:hypothetical protein